MVKDMRRNERPYQYIEPLKKEIEEMQRLVDKWQSDLARCEDPSTQKHIQKLIDTIRKRKNELIAEYNSIIEELEEIKAENREVYLMIYWHDVKHLTWLQTYNKVCPDLIYAEPESHCKKTVHRYLSKKFNLPKWK